jgi:sialate O-acetylesterase
MARVLRVRKWTKVFALQRRPLSTTSIASPRLFRQRTPASPLGFVRGFRGTPFFPMKKSPTLLLIGVTLLPLLRAELKLPAIISDHMVLQQKHPNPIWGWDTPGTKVTVTFAGQTQTATADNSGKWIVKLAALPANATAQTLAVAGTSKREIKDVLIGEVWMCSGQSNMGWTLSQTYTGDLEGAASNLPNLRLITVPRVGTQELKSDFTGQWQAATPQTAKAFSAVGFLYGRYIHEILGVPVGLINNAWGGSAAEAWVRRDALEKDPRFKALMERTTKREVQLQSAKGKADFVAATEKWKADSAKAKAEKKTVPQAPRDWLIDNSRPGNIFAGMVHPTVGYGMKGVIWYQGESNAGTAYEHATLFPFLIEQWRKEWGQGDFSFYWVQLADFMAEKPTPGDSNWAELRETQTKTMKLPKTGQAVIIDLGEARDIHPRNKYDVASRLVRWALVKDYGLTFAYRSPELKSATFNGNTARLTLDCFGSSLRAFDVAEVKGFAICGADKVWHWADAKIVGRDQVEVSSEKVPEPIAVRYAWADNPVCNLYSAEGLPVTPFRTDDFDMITKPKSQAVAAKP